MTMKYKITEPSNEPYYITDENFDDIFCDMTINEIRALCRGDAVSLATTDYVITVELVPIA